MKFRTLGLPDNVLSEIPVRMHMTLYLLLFMNCERLSGVFLQIFSTNINILNVSHCRQCSDLMYMSLVVTGHQ